MKLTIKFTQFGYILMRQSFGLWKLLAVECSPPSLYGTFTITPAMTTYQRPSGWGPKTIDIISEKYLQWFTGLS